MNLKMTSLERRSEEQRYGFPNPFWGEGVTDRVGTAVETSVHDQTWGSVRAMVWLEGWEPLIWPNYLPMDNI